MLNMLIATVEYVLCTVAGFMLFLVLPAVVISEPWKFKNLKTYLKYMTTDDDC